MRDDLPEAWERALFEEIARMRAVMYQLLSVRNLLEASGLTEERWQIESQKRGCRR